MRKLLKDNAATVVLFSVWIFTLLMCALIAHDDSFKAWVDKSCSDLQIKDILGIGWILLMLNALLRR